MPTVKANEREFMSQVISWLNEFLSSGTYPFETASSDPSIEMPGEKTKFPDVLIWRNRLAKQGFCGWELKTSATAVDDSDLLENAAEKATAMNANYFVTWNMRDAVIWRTPLPNVKVTSQDRFKSYPSLYQVSAPDDLWVEPNKILLKNRAKEILEDLKTLYLVGHLHLIDVDATYFVGRLQHSVKTLYPYLQKSLTGKVGSDAKFKKNLFDWAVKQGIANYAAPGFYETVSRQMVYRLLARILFYQTLRRHWSSLPQIDLSGLSADTANKKLREIFEQARQIDWHAVFEEDFSDSIAVPDSGIEELDKLIKDLNRFNFSIMPQDVIGAVFEKLIPYEERHSLGQYFTPENLVDLINAFCVRTVNDHVLDPTCGTGTFLTRAYDKMKTAGQREHKKLLSQLWGIDIAHFPAQLATINLFRQDLSDFANFPRIISRDFFEVRLGQSFKFPPPKVGADSSFQMIEEKLPEFDAAVGNFPYIRQELIEKQVKGYKNILEDALKEDWLRDYPDAFVITENELKEFKRNHKIDFSRIGFKLSGQADIYAYLFFHTARFLKEGGRMGFVTSNSWLDVGYGYELQKFLLNNFKLVAILESRCEPWFEDAAINTIVTIVERCSTKEERDNNIAKFIRVKKRLAELIPWDMKLEASKRWFGLGALVYRIESVGKEHYKIEKEAIVSNLTGLESYEDDDFRVRFVMQKDLLNEVKTSDRTAKWGWYLRAPQVYFDVLREATDKFPTLDDLADVNRGITTNNVGFFYLTPERLEHWAIEKGFILSPVVYSPREVPNIKLDASRLKYSLFVCNKTKKKLIGTNASKYIESAESQGINKSLSLQGKDDWYSIGNIQTKPCSLFYARQDDKFRVVFNPEAFVVNDNLYTIVPKDDIDNELLCALLNSSLFALGLEVNGRVNLGEGALKVQAYELGMTRLPDPRTLSVMSKKDIVKAFRNLLNRPILPVFEEVKMKDRQKLDSLILQALGLDPDKYLKPIYDGLTELVRERMELAGMRKKVKQVKTQRDVDRLKKQVMEEVLPNGLKKFPDEFLEAPLKPQDYQNISIPGEPLKLGMFFLGTQQVVSDSGFTFEAKSVDEAKYAIYSQKPNTFVVSLPKDSVVITKAVNDYERYLRKLRDDLFQALFKRTFDHKLSDTLVQRAFAELGLPDIATT